MRVPVSGGELACAVAGAGQPIVFLHGGLLDSSTWQLEFEALASNWRVVRYDARGHGDSSTPAGDYSHSEDLAALLDTLEIELAVLCGLSLGGRTAVDFALQWPHRVRALVLCAPGFSGMDVAGDPFVAEQGAEQASAIAARDAGRFVEAFLRMWVDGPRRQPGEVEAELRARCREIALRNIGRHAAGKGQARELHAITRLDELAMPILAFEGGMDSPTIAVVLDQLMAARPGARRVLIPEAGHMVNLEGGVAFLDPLRAWLQGLDG